MAQAVLRRGRTAALVQNAGSMGAQRPDPVVLAVADRGRRGWGFTVVGSAAIPWSVPSRTGRPTLALGDYGAARTSRPARERTTSEPFHVSTDPLTVGSLTVKLLGTVIPLLCIRLAFTSQWWTPTEGPLASTLDHRSVRTGNEQQRSRAGGGRCRLLRHGSADAPLLGVDLTYLRPSARAVGDGAGRRPRRRLLEIY